MVCQSLGHVWIHGLPTPSLLPRLIHARELTVEILVFIYLRHSCFTHVHMSLDTPLAPFPFSSSFLTVYDFLGFVFKAVAWCVCACVCARARTPPNLCVLYLRLARKARRFQSVHPQERKRLALESERAAKRLRPTSVAAVQKIRARWIC